MVSHHICYNNSKKIIPSYPPPPPYVVIQSLKLTDKVLKTKCYYQTQNSTLDKVLQIEHCL
jgi:hypothetical protein